MKFAYVLVIIVTSAISLSGQPVAQDAEAYEVEIIAGIDTATFLKDGIGDAATFTTPTALWGDGTYLYVADGPALRRIEIATRQVTTITRLAGTDRIKDVARSSYYGLSSMWGDGSSVYVTDAGDSSVRRVNLSSGLVDVVAQVEFPLGIVGSGRFLYVAPSSGHRIQRIDTTTGTVADFAVPPGPLDPSRCFGGSGCINHFIPSPTSLSIDGENIYATGFDTTLRIVNTSTAEVTSSPQVPFIPGWVWGDSGVVYYTENFGNRIGKLILATGEVSIIFQGTPPSSGGSYFLRAIWGDSNFLYVTEGDHILRVNPATGTSEVFAGTDRRSIDGAGTVARFGAMGGLWSDGTSLFIVDRVEKRIRKLDLATREVTTLPYPLQQPRRVWGDGAYLYVTDENMVRRIRLSDGETTNFVLQNYSEGVWSDHTALYVSDSATLQRIPLDGGAISTVASGFTGGEGDVWGDGSYVYLGPCRYICGQIFRYSIADAETTIFTALPASVPPDPPVGIWGDGNNLFVTQANSGQVWRISLGSGAVHPVLRSGSGPDAGKALQLRGGITGAGDSLYIGGGSAIYKLTPSSIPPFSGFRTPDRGAASDVTNSTADTITVGSASLEFDANSAGASGFAIFTHRENGIVVSEAAVQASMPIRSGRIYASIAAPVNTGLAIANPNDHAATINFYFTDAAGIDFGRGSATIPAHGQMARFLNEAPFWVPSRFGSFGIPGTFTFGSSVPVSAIALRGYVNERSEFLMTTLPVLDLSAAGAMAPLVMAHFADGGGWTTSVVLVNPTNQSISGNIEFYSDSGALLSTAQYGIAPRSSFIFRTLGSNSQVQAGSIRVVPAASVAPSGAAIFSFRRNGIVVTEAGVQAVTPQPAFRLYTERTENAFRRDGAPGTMETGVSIANPSSSSITVYFEETTIQGMPLRLDRPSIGTLTLPAQGHRSLFLSELFLPPVFPFGYPYYAKGVLRMWTDSPAGVSIIGLRARYNERGDFLVTTTPSSPELPAPTPSPLYFPQIVQGGGYTTQIVILGNTPGQSSSGTIRYFSQAGTPLTVPLN